MKTALAQTRYVLAGTVGSIDMAATLKSHRKRPFNRTQIKNGKIVRINKNGTIRSVLDDYKVKHAKQLKPKSER